MNELMLTISWSIIVCFGVLMLAWYIYLAFVTRSKVKEEKVIITYSETELERLFMTALPVMQKNAVVLSHPYFYTTSVEKNLVIVPQYKDVLRLCKYILLHNQSKNDLNSILTKHFGENYENSPELNVVVKQDYNEYFHYLMNDIDDSLSYYIRYRDVIDKIL